MRLLSKQFNLSHNSTSHIPHSMEQLITMNAFQQDIEDNMIKDLVGMMPHEMLKKIATYMDIFRMEWFWKQRVLKELMAEQPVLKRAYPHTNPNRFFERKWYDDLRYSYARRVWDYEFDHPGVRSLIEIQYWNEKTANEYWIKRLNWYPNRSWNETVQMLRHHWDVFRYLRTDDEN